MRNLDPAELQALLSQGKVRLLDVREPAELEMAQIPGALHIPLGELAARLEQLRDGPPLVALCHHGVRSELAGRLLEHNGFTGVAHLRAYP